MSAKHRGRVVANHKLYPLKIDELYNPDKFWKIWQPEDFEDQWKLEVSKVETRSHFLKNTKEDDDHDIIFYLNCPHCSDKNCEFFFGNSEGTLIICTACNWHPEDWPKAELEEVRCSYSWESIKMLATSAKPSTNFLNPFENIAYHQFDNERQEISWLIEDLIPANSIGSLVGPSGSCKSFVALSMAKAISANVSFMNRETAFGTVLYLAPDGGDQIEPRLKAWDIEHGRDGWYTRFYSNHHLINLESEEFFSQLSRRLNQNKEFNYKLLVIDSLKKSIESSDSDDATVAKVFRNLSKLKNETGISILLIDHTGHKTGQRASGSYQKYANNDFEYFVKKEGTQVTLVNKKMRSAHPPLDLVMKAVPRHGSLVLEASKPPQTPEEILLNLLEHSKEIGTDQLRKLFMKELQDVADTTRRRWFDKAISTLIMENRLEKIGGILRRTCS